jgi:hypothetical protein
VLRRLEERRLVPMMVPLVVVVVLVGAGHRGSLALMSA